MSPRPSVEAPVNAPLAWPNSSDWIKVAWMAPQFTGTNGPLARLEWRWMACAVSSLPLPLWPHTSTGASTLATRKICRSSSFAAALLPTMDVSPAGAWAARDACRSAA